MLSVGATVGASAVMLTPIKTGRSQARVCSKSSLVSIDSHVAHTLALLFEYENVKLVPDRTYGDAEGWAVGRPVGKPVGSAEGDEDGSPDGDAEGWAVGRPVGKPEGSAEGDEDGIKDGDAE